MNTVQAVYSLSSIQKCCMKSILIVLCVLVFSCRAQAADTTRLYNPAANATRDIANLVQKAKAEKKHVLVQVGGNWCVWCYRFNAFVQTDTLLRQIAKNSFLIYHLNYSKENKNLDVLAKLGYPQRFGFPVLVVLDADGNRLHTQDSGLLEKGNGYDRDKVLGFFSNWAPTALLPAAYRE